MIDFEKVYFIVSTKEDEKKWKEFLHKYFPNHYAKGLLEENLVCNHLIGVDVNGYGILGTHILRLHIYKRVKDFEEFKDTKCYKMILEKGITLEEGKPKIIHIKNKEEKNEKA